MTSVVGVGHPARRPCRGGMVKRVPDSGPSWSLAYPPRVVGGGARNSAADARPPTWPPGQITWSRACISLISACCALMICWARLRVVELLP
jgi:hypothetical protein